MEHIATLDRYIAGRFGKALDVHDREEIRQEAFVSLQLMLTRGQAIHSDEAMLITCARHAALSRLRSADRRRRYPFDPLDSRELSISDPSVPPDVEVIEADEDRRLRERMSGLEARDRRLLELQLDLGMEVREVAEVLGLSVSHVYKLTKRAGRAIWNSAATS